MVSPKVELPELLRAFAIQDTPDLMLFLGAGASVRAGIPAAGELIWMFKRTIYCSETGASEEAFRDLSVERNRQRLQSHFDAKKGFPMPGDENEYSFYFERCYPDPSLRRSFIRQLLRQGVPTIGHECLAVLLDQNRCDWLWTTNFDDLVERAERSSATRRLSQVGPESRDRMETIFTEKLRPVLVKLHGDYRYDKLQNTSAELQSLDESLRHDLAEISKDKGMIVIGYSGRDESVISALEEAISTSGFPCGLYWCIREGEQPNARVQSLVQSVAEATGRGGFVEVSSFDDAIFRLYRQCGLKDEKIDSKAESLFQQRQPFALVTEQKSHNLIKVNAIKVVEYPTTPYRFKTSIVNWQELRDIVNNHPIIAGLLQGHVVAFGNRELIRTVFSGKITGQIEVADIRRADLTRSDSVMMGLLYDVVARSLIEEYGLLRIGRRTFYMPDPATSGRPRNFRFAHQGKQYNVPMVTNDRGAIINEAFSFQLDFHEGNLWFVIEPSVVVTSNGRDLAPLDTRKLIANRVISSRYNMAVHDRLLLWVYFLASVSHPASFVFPSRDIAGVRITLASHYAFSSARDKGDL